MIELVLLGALVLTNAGFLFLVAIILKRHADTVDMLTSKIMAPSLDSYAVATPNKLKVDTKVPQTKAPTNSPFQSIDTVNPEDGMKALAMAAGRLDEYEGAV